MKKWMFVVLGWLLVGAGLLGIPASVLTGFILPESYMSRARLIVQSPAPTDPRSAMKPAPNWIETEAQFVLSKRVLTNVIANLGLAKRWSERFKETEALPPEVCVALLKQQIEIHQVKNTGLIEVAVASEDRNEASQIANEIAAVYSRLRGEDAKVDDRNRGRELRPVEIVDMAEPAFRPSRSPLKLMAPGVAVSVLLLFAGIASLLAAKRFDQTKAKVQSNPPPVPR